MSLVELVGAVVDELPPSIDGFHIEPRCRVCRNDGVRKKVNDLLASGSSYAMILRALEDANATLDKGDRVTIDSIRNHTARHFPVQHVARATYRDILERRAKENSVDFVEGVATAITPMAFLETVMVKGYEALVDPDTTVDVKTGMIAAGRLQELIDSRAGQPDMGGMLAEMGRIIEIVRTFVPSERWPEVQAALRGDASIERQQQSSPVGGVRMVAIDDTPDEDGY
jgi:hypothetical protein